MDFSKKYWQVIETEAELAQLKKEAEEFTYEQLALKYHTSKSKMYVVCHSRGVKAKRPERLKRPKRPKKEKVISEAQLIRHWANTYNQGRLRYVYYDMIRRCYNPKDKGYYRYGKRGITVCSEWKNNHLAFFRWAKESGYTQGLQLDRIDNDKGYYPDNCHWVTAKENSLNRCCTRWVEYNGEKHTLKRWADITGIEYQVLADRIYRYGWTIEKALTTDTKHDWIHNRKS